MKILLIGEYSGFHKELKSALVELGHEVTLAASSDFWKKFDADINLGYGTNIYSYKARQLFLPLLKLKYFRGYDIVHLINFYTVPRFPSLNLFLVKFLKKNNNIVTLAGAGDDPFFVKYAEEALRYSPIPSHEKIDRKKPYYMRGKNHLEVMHETVNYVDGIIPIMYEYYATFCKAGYGAKTSTPLPIPINTNNIKFENNKITNRIIFFHGLNRPGFKGTNIIEKCFLELNKKYPSDVECILDGKLPFDKYLKLLSRVNVSVDQLYSYSLAMNALYSMAQGKVVVGGAEPESSILYNGDLPPIYNGIPNHNTLMEIFHKILDERKNFEAKSIASREFVKASHCPKLVAVKYIEYWNSLS